jgi:hypothetical protein
MMFPRSIRLLDEIRSHGSFLQYQVEYQEAVPVYGCKMSRAG